MIIIDDHHDEHPSIDSTTMALLIAITDDHYFFFFFLVIIMEPIPCGKIYTVRKMIMMMTTMPMTMFDEDDFDSSLKYLFLITLW